jgi:hypothetical protein
VTPIALGTVAWIATAIVLLFGALLILTYTLSLVRQTKHLARVAASARERLQAEAGSLREEMAAARARLDGIEARRKERGSRRPERPKGSHGVPSPQGARLPDGDGT